eukprot:5581580-Pleurochrysis_carterae.AAC.1
MENADLVVVCCSRLRWAQRKWLEYGLTAYCYSAHRSVATAVHRRHEYRAVASSGEYLRSLARRLQPAHCFCAQGGGGDEAEGRFAWDHAVYKTVTDKLLLTGQWHQPS